MRRLVAPILYTALWGTGVTVAQPYGTECPAGTITGQNAGGTTWEYSDTTFDNPPDGSGRVVCEKFPPPNEPVLSSPIAALSFHGSYANPFTPSGTRGCIKNHKFELRFYPHIPMSGGGPKPDVTNPAAIYTDVIPEYARIIGTLDWPGGESSAELIFGVTLDPPFDPALVNGQGWVSIASTEEAGDCYFVLGPADEGNGIAWRYWMDNPLGGERVNSDIHYCLGAATLGACCDDWSGLCAENRLEFVCDLGGSRFAVGQCASIDPLCGRTTGACCLAVQTCIPDLTRAACAAIPGAYWRGPDTTCEDCCWTPACPGGSHVEYEMCGQSTNGGCGVEPNVFETIPTNGFVCGTVWADDGKRDEDWYEFTLTQQGKITVANIDTQVPLRLTLYFSEDYGPPQCDELWYYAGTLWSPCETGAFAPPNVWPAGRYWLFAAPEDGEGEILDFYPCNTANEYMFELVVDYIACPDPCSIPGAPVHPENEPDYCTDPEPDTFNSGCDQLTAPPGPALPITDNHVLWCGKTGYYEYDPQTGICRGDLNCDEFIDMGDINPFVLFLTDPWQWQWMYPECPPENGDINGDGYVTFADINAFVNLLASGGGKPIPCPTSRDLIPDTDWYEFEVKHGPHEALFFWHPEEAMTWEIYDQAAGCEAPPLERHSVRPCLFGFQQTCCLAPGMYWLRLIPAPGVECGKEYVLGLDELIECELCDVDCHPQDIPENEHCGERLNNVCYTQAMPIEPKYDLQKVVCGTLYNLLVPEVEGDIDWYKFDVPAGPNMYLVVVLNSDFPVTPWMTINGCQGTGWLTQDGIGCDPLGDLNGFFVDKEDVPGGSHVDLHITTSLYNPDEGGWYDQPGHFPCPNQYRMLAGYTPTEPTAAGFPGIQWHKLTLQAPACDASFDEAKVTPQ